jgi:hypothetical protein
MRLSLLPVALLSIIGTPVFACSCDTVQFTPVQMLRRVDAVFFGEVIESSDRSTNSALGYVTITFKVERYWKGVKQDKVVIYSSNSNCGFRSRVGEKRLIYAYKTAERKLNTDMCTLGAVRISRDYSPMSDAAQMRYLGKGIKPRSKA